MHRIFVGWKNGSYVTSLSPDFKQQLKELIAQFGMPDTVELRKMDEKWRSD